MKGKKLKAKKSSTQAAPTARVEIEIRTAK